MAVWQNKEFYFSLKFSYTYKEFGSRIIELKLHYLLIFMKNGSHKLIIQYSLDYYAKDGLHLYLPSITCRKNIRTTKAVAAP